MANSVEMDQLAINTVRMLVVDAVERGELHFVRLGQAFAVEIERLPAVGGFDSRGHVGGCARKRRCVFDRSWAYRDVVGVIGIAAAASTARTGRWAIWS